MLGKMKDTTTLSFEARLLLTRK